MADKKLRDVGITHIRELAKEYEKMEVFELDDERQVQFYPVFTDDKVDELLREMKGLIEQAMAKNIELEDHDVENMLLFLCVKHFTHLKNKINDQLDYQLALYQDMVKSGLFKTIVNDVFSPVELHKVFIAYGELLGSNMYLETVEKTAHEYAQQLEFKNKSLMEELKKEKEMKKTAEEILEEMDETETEKEDEQEIVTP